MTTPNQQLAEPPDYSSPIAEELRETFRVLDALGPGWIAVLSATTTAPPGSPGQGDVYLVPESATGDWAGHAKHIALFTPTGWIYRAPRPGWIAIDMSAETPFGRVLEYVGTAWTPWLLPARQVDVDVGDYSSATDLQTLLDAMLGQDQHDAIQLADHEIRIADIEAITGGGAAAAVTIGTVTVVSGATLNLTTEGNADWFSWGNVAVYNQTQRAKRSGLRFPKRMQFSTGAGAAGGTGSLTTWGFSSAPSFSALDAHNTAASGTVADGSFRSCLVGESFFLQVALPAGASTVRIYMSNGFGFDIFATLDDGTTDSVTTSGIGNVVIPITVSASRPGQVLAVEVRKTGSTGNLGFSCCTVQV